MHRHGWVSPVGSRVGVWPSDRLIRLIPVDKLGACTSLCPSFPPEPARPAGTKYGVSHVADAPAAVQKRCEADLVQLLDNIATICRSLWGT